MASVKPILIRKLEKNGHIFKCTTHVHKYNLVVPGFGLDL